LLIMRDKRRGGASIEGIFQSLQIRGDENIQFETWHYDDTKSKWSNMRSLRRRQADIYHITGDIYYVAMFLWGKKVLLTIHDIGAYKRFQGFKQWLYGKLWIAWPVRMATAVVAVSDFTRQDVAKRLIGSGNKLQTIYNGYNPEFESHVKEFASNPARILVVGTTIHKNVETVIRTLAGKPHTLIIIGKPSNEQMDLLQFHAVNYEIHSNLNTIELYEQYKQADMLVFISLHEGFGMPIIEAQAIGRPVITTNMASIPEIAGEGVYFMKDPFDAKELEIIVDKLLQDDEYRMTLIEKGRLNASRFTLNTMVHNYNQLYHHLNVSQKK
jgi:glycosyltransferase involved in cell wall biosynthesis